MKDIYAVNCCRTAIGSFQGTLANTKSSVLGTIVVKEALRRAGISSENVDEVIFGSILTTAQGQNIARQVSVGAEIPYETPAFTLNMVCGSGMKAVVEAARAILAGDADIIVTGGTENMTMAPYAVPSARGGARMFDATMVDTMVNEGLWDVFNNYHMGITAENICDQWEITREELDAFAYDSQIKCKAAKEAGRFDAEIVPVLINQKKQVIEFKIDEYPRDNITMEGLAKLRPAFKPDGGRVTAGNSSGINDGAAAVVIASGEAVKKYGLKPMAKLISWGHGGLDPKIMGAGPIPASRNALSKAGLTISDMDLIEANEAFAAQSIAVARELEFDMTKVNVNGGAISLGHPVGCSGARIIVTMLHEMHKRPEAKLGLATLCIGGGMGIATIWEKC